MWGNFFLLLLQVNKEELEPVTYSFFLELNRRFKQVAFFTFGEAQTLQTMVPDRLRGLRAEHGAVLVELISILGWNAVRLSFILTVSQFPEL